MEKVRICMRCQKPIEPGHPEAKYCNKCRDEVHMETWESVKRERRKAAEEEMRQKKLKKKKYTGPSVAEINKAAEELGMSYGQYVSKYGSVIV